jgi:hypothetical protein
MGKQPGPVGEVALAVLSEWLHTLEHDGHLYELQQLAGHLDQLGEWGRQHNMVEARQLGSVAQALRWLDDGTVANAVRRIRTAAFDDEGVSE